MRNRTKTQRGNAGPRQTAAGSSSVSHPHSSTNCQGKQFLSLPNGRQGRGVGYVLNRALHKEVRSSRHMLHKPRAWALDVAILEQAERLGAQSIEVHDTETGPNYTVSLSRFMRQGRRFNRGHGPQMYLTLDCWHVLPRGWQQPDLFGGLAV